MSRWNIYHKDGTKLTDVNDDEVVVHGLQYSDKWMGDCFLTVDFKNNAPINFKIGDYIIYRGERFELNYEPGKDKKASLNTYGEGFVYDSVKFNALQDELSRSEFLDVVLNDNELHYTSLPKFLFYVESLDDLLDRIQANLDEQIGKGVWKVYSRNKKRSLQRGCSDADWTNVYGGGTPKNVIESKSITVDGKTCWEALALVNSEWDVNFIVRGRNVYVGTAGVLAKNIFKYGLGKGLSELIQNADSEQQIVTRLRAYGSEKNLPSHYYADLGVKYFCNITEVNTATSYLSVYIDMEYIDNYFTIPRVFVPNDGTGKEHTYGYVLKVTFDFQTVITCVVTALSSGQAVMLYSEVKNNMEDNGDEPSKENLDRFIAQVNAGNRKIYIVDGLNKKAVPSSMKEYAKNLPNNMSINRLMLPGFPHVSLNDYYNSLSKADKEYVNPTGKEHVFSTNPHRPYIDSVNIQQIGLRSASQYFDNDDKTNGIVEIYPTIEEMVVGGVRVDEIDEGVAPDDNGRFEDGQTVNNVDIYLNPSIDFDINDLKDSDFSIAMKDGMCGGRTFKVASSVKENGRWRLTIQRVKDDALELWFPYKDYPIRKGDHFVLTGITLPDSYVNAASLKLLKYAIAYIDKNDYTRYVYQPKVDEVFMARQNDQATEDKTGTIKSLHDTLKAGDIMEFDDGDLHIGGKVTIDQLVIRENEGGIPTYEVTLRNNVEVGTMAKIKQQISSLESGNGKVSSETSKQITDSTINEALKHFLSKLKDDVAQGLITFAKGLVSDGLAKLNKGTYFGEGGALIDEIGHSILESLQSIDYDNEAEQGFAVKKENGKYHAFVTNLTIWGKAIFNQLEVRKLSYAGGNVYLSGAGSKIVKVVPVIWESESSEWIETSVDKKCEGWLCYLLADDGTTATENLWREGDQVRCKTIGTLATGTTNASNKSYWRTIPAYGVSSENKKIYDEYDNELYGGQMFSWIVIGKHSLSLDSMTEEFATAEIGGIPEAGDTIVLDGHRAVFVGGQIVDDDSRKGVLILESTGENTPRIVGFKGVDRYTHDGKEVFVLSPDRIRLNSSIFEWVSPSGDTMHMVNYRGEWKEGSYDYYDQVNHNNALWTCINENGTSQEPSDASSDWQKVLSGEKGEKGEKGDRGDEGPQGPKGETGTQGEKGEQGTPGVNGNDGITWLLTPDTLMYDTDDNGKAINVGTGKTTTLRVLRGDEELTDVTIVGVKNMVNCVASRLNNTSSFYISAIAVQEATLGTDTMDVSCTNGSFDIDFSVDGVTYTATAKFAVNVSAFTGRMTLSNRQFKTEITSLQRTMQSGLEDLDSKITQTAEDITLSVSKKKAGRRNLLYGTAFTRAGLIDVSPQFHFQPTMTEGMNGMNAVRFSVTASDSFQYHGLFWRGEYGNIPVKRNTDYTFSCWVKSDNPRAMLYTERYSKSDATTSERGTAIPLSKGEVWWRNDGNWQLVTNTFNSGDTDFVEIAIFLFNADENSKPTLNALAWFCMPMLEEGLEYTGWTLSERDSDYVGGNMLDDTRTFVASSQQSNLFLAQDVTADAYEGAYAVAHGKADESNNNACDFLRFNGEGGRNLDLGQYKNYVFSFLAKGNGTLVTYMYKDSVHASIYSENSQGYVMQSIANGASNFTLTSQWKRYWVHWRIDPYTGDGDTVLPQSVLLRAVDGCEVWVTKPKLEEGAQVTEYTEKKTDLIDKSTAKAAGLEITADGVELYGDKVKVKNNGKTAAMFTDGKLNADLIDADTINVHHVWAKDGNNQNTLAHFGNYGIDEAKDEKGRSCPLWVGSSTASSSPFRVSKDGYMYAEKGAFGIRYFEDEESGEQRAYGRFEITANGIETGEVFKEDSMSLTDTRFHLIKQKGNNEKLSNDAIFLDSHGDTLPVPGLGVYLKAKVRVDATGVLNSESNVCYYANAKNGLQNYAIYGSGDISLDGGVYAYKATMVKITTKNVFLDNTGLIKATTYNEPQTIDSLTLLVNSQSGYALTLPTLGTIEQMLFGSYAMRSKFCVRLTVIIDIGSETFFLRGRSANTDNAGGVAQWNINELPVITSKDGNYTASILMKQGNSCEIMLTYDPNKKYKVGEFEQNYIARFIN